MISAVTVQGNLLTPTVFHEPWWLQIVTGGTYRIAEVTEGNTVVGRMPYYINRSMGMDRIDMPPLTHFLGPSVVASGADENARFLKRHDVTRELIRQLPLVTSTYMKCHRGIDEVIAFQGEAFRASVQFTHELKPENQDVAWNKLHSKRRSTITKAQKQLSCETITDLSEFLKFNDENLCAYKLKSHYSPEILQKLIEAAITHDQGRIIAARDDKGKLVTATFCVWDQNAYYFLMGTRKPNANRGALSLLVWESIKDAIQKGLIFDLDGVSNDASVSFYSKFGATIKPRYIVTRQTRIGKLYMSARSLVKKDGFYF